MARDIGFVLRCEAEITSRPLLSKVDIVAIPPCGVMDCDDGAPNPGPSENSAGGYNST